MNTIVKMNIGSCTSCFSLSKNKNNVETHRQTQRESNDFLNPAPVALAESVESHRAKHNRNPNTTKHEPWCDHVFVLACMSYLTSAWTLKFTTNAGGDRVI